MTGTSYVLDMRIELASLRKRCLDAEAELAAKDDTIAELASERGRFAEAVRALVEHRSALAIAVCDYLDEQPGVGASHLRGVEQLARQVVGVNEKVVQYLEAASRFRRRE